MSPFELLLFGLLIAGVILFNYLTQQAAKKARQREARQAAAPDAITESAWGRTPGASAQPATEAMEPYKWGRPREALESHAARPLERTRAVPAPSLEEIQALAQAKAEAERTPSPAPRRPAQAARLFRSRDDLRRAVIAMTVLGPCRAIEPAELFEPGRPAPRAR